MSTTSSSSSSLSSIASRQMDKSKDDKMDHVCANEGRDEEDHHDKEIDLDKENRETPPSTPTDSIANEEQDLAMFNDADADRRQKQEKDALFHLERPSAVSSPPSTPFLFLSFSEEVQSFLEEPNEENMSPGGGEKRQQERLQEIRQGRRPQRRRSLVSTVSTASLSEPSITGVPSPSWPRRQKSILKRKSKSKGGTNSTSTRFHPPSMVWTKNDKATDKGNGGSSNNQEKRVNGSHKEETSSSSSSSSSSTLGDVLTRHSNDFTHDDNKEDNRGVELEYKKESDDSTNNSVVVGSVGTRGKRIFRPIPAQRLITPWRPRCTQRNS